MKKICHLFLFFSVLYLSSLSLSFGQEITFTAQAPSSVPSGESFELVYTVSASPDNIKPPPFSPFLLLQGPFTSFSSSSYISGRTVKKTVTTTYTYVLQAGNPGKFTIPPAKCTVDGKQYQSEEVQIEVTKAATGLQSPNPASKGGQNTTIDAGGEELFAALIPDKKSVFIGEPIVVTLKIFDRLGLRRLENTKLPTFSGFYKQDIETPPLRQLIQENVNGKIFNTGVLARFVLYPQKSGSLIIEKAEFDGLVEQSSLRRSNDWWGFDIPTIEQKPVQFFSKPVTINVKELPSGQSADFSGAVGEYTLSVTTDKTELTTNDALTVKVKISGSGNLGTIEPLKIQFPPDFESYTPKTSLNQKAGLQGTTGSVTFEYLVIPRHPGDFSIPPVALEYFSPSKKAFQKLQSKEILLKVSRGSGDTTLRIFSGNGAEDIKFIGKDIRYIKTDAIKLAPADYYLISDWRFFLGYLMPLLLFACVIFLRRKMIREKANKALVRNRKANKMAGKRLKKAKLFLQENKRNEFFEEILSAIWGYLSDKLLLPLSELSREKAFEILDAKGINSATKKELTDLLDVCEAARYAPITSLPPLHEVLENAITLISEIDENLK